MPLVIVLKETEVSEMKLGTNFLPFKAGVIRGSIYGGPFKSYEQGTRRLVGVKMAKEIKHPHEIDIPVVDYGIPEESVMQMGLLRALAELERGNDIYAGCMGGVGRTGLFIGCMSKVLIDYHAGAYMGEIDPVKLTRKVFKGHAIETPEQEAFVLGFDTEVATTFITSKQPVDLRRFVSVDDHHRVVNELTTDLADTAMKLVVAQKEVQHLRRPWIVRAVLSLVRGTSVTP